jgi:hypothetical protein
MHLLQPSRPDVLRNPESWLIKTKRGESSAARGQSIAYAFLIQRHIADLLHRSNNSSRRAMYPSGRAGYDQRSCSLVLQYSSLYVPKPGPIGLMVDFGFLTFLHEADYWERFERGDIPVGLTLLMAANALRYVLHHGLIPNPVSYLLRLHRIPSSPQRETVLHDSGY